LKTWCAWGEEVDARRDLADNEEKEKSCREERRA
jgi:hypothetical protein